MHGNRRTVMIDFQEGWAAVAGLAPFLGAAFFGADVLDLALVEADEDARAADDIVIDRG